jgi:hypothetical protein
MKEKAWRKEKIEEDKRLPKKVVEKKPPATPKVPKVKGPPKVKAAPKIKLPKAPKVPKAKVNRTELSPSTKRLLILLLRKTET